MGDELSQSVPAKGKRGGKRKGEEVEPTWRMSDKLERVAVLSYKDLQIDVDQTHGQVCSSPALCNV